MKAPPEAVGDGRPHGWAKQSRAVPLVVVIALTVVPCLPAAALDAICPPNLGAVVVEGNLVVVALCDIDGTTVEGNVQLLGGGTLRASQAAVHGNIDGALAASLMLFDSVVAGNVDLDAFIGALSRISLSRIDGNVTLTDNLSRLELQDNVIDGNLQIQRNSGGVQIIDNLIDGNLRCTGNSPSPSGSGNSVTGNISGQCVNLQPVPTGDAGDDEPPQQDLGDDEPPLSAPEDNIPPTLPEPDEPPADEAASDGISSGSGAAAGAANSVSDNAPAPLVLNPQPSGGGAAFSLLELLLLTLMIAVTGARRSR